MTSVIVSVHGESVAPTQFSPLAEAPASQRGVRRRGRNGWASEVLRRRCRVGLLPRRRRLGAA